MCRLRTLLVTVAVGAAALSSSAISQEDTTGNRPPPGVRLGLSYGPGVKPGVIIFPIDETPGDSIRAILQRDLDYSDRINVIALNDSSLRALVPARGKLINFPLVAKFGAALLIRARPTATGVHVTAYDVAAGKVFETADFALPARSRNRNWRFAVHGISDEIEKWILGKRGIAQSRIAYVSGGTLRLIDSDGAESRAVTAGRGALSPAWSPTGRSIVFSILGNTGTQIAELDLATGRTRRIGRTPPGLNITPVFHPAGSSVVFAHGFGEGADLVLADPDSGGLRRLTVGRGSDNTSPTFSPDGRQISFTSGRSGRPQVYIMDADGTNLQLLTEYDLGVRSYRTSPDWSPDGRAIAYQQQNGDFQIWKVDLRDRIPRQLTSEGENEDPSWAPDGRHLVFASTRGGTKQLWVLDTESGRFRQLTHDRGARLAAWSPMLGAADTTRTSQ